MRLLKTRSLRFCVGFSRVAFIVLAKHLARYGDFALTQVGKCWHKRCRAPLKMAPPFFCSPFISFRSSIFIWYHRHWTLSLLPGIHFILCLSGLFSSCPCLRPSCSRRMNFFHENPGWCNGARFSPDNGETANICQFVVTFSQRRVLDFSCITGGARDKNSANFSANAFSKYNYVHRPIFADYPRNGITLSAYAVIQSHRNWIEIRSRDVHWST